jgi:hypothetical protein
MQEKEEDKYSKKSFGYSLIFFCFYGDFRIFCGYKWDSLDF